MQQRISLVTLGVADLARAVRFYDALGWRVANDFAAQDVAFYEVSGGMVFALWGRGELAEDCGVADGGGWGGIALAYNVRSPAEVDAALAEAEAAGATISRPAGETFYGGYSGVFVDPDGHAWEVAHNPNWTMDAEGAISI
jgi:uncharacterized protein